MPIPFHICGVAKITVLDDCSLSMNVRKPNWCSNMTVNGEDVSQNYFVIDKNFAKGESLDVNIDMTLEVHNLNGKVAFTYGPLTLASDEQKSQRELQKPVVITDEFKCQAREVEGWELVRFECTLEKDDVLVLTDYQSCGKKWLSDKPLMTVWFNGK